MKQKKIKKPRSILFRIILTIIKIPVFILMAAFNTKTKEKEPDIIEDLYAQDPSLFESKKPSRHHPYR